jgi:hypothetical protein
MATQTDRPPPTGDTPPFRTYELWWENHKPKDDLFRDGVKSDPSVFFHGTASTREEMIDRDGLLPHPRSAPNPRRHRANSAPAGIC